MAGIWGTICALRCRTTSSAPPLFQLLPTQEWFFSLIWDLFFWLVQYLISAWDVLNSCTIVSALLISYFLNEILKKNAFKKRSSPSATLILMCHILSFQVSLPLARSHPHSCFILKNGRILCIQPLNQCPQKPTKLHSMLSKMTDTGGGNNLSSGFSLSLHLKEVSTSDELHQWKKTALFSC